LSRPGYRDRYLGVPIPPTNIQDDQLDTARGFASKLADRLGAATTLHPAPKFRKAQG